MKDKVINFKHPIYGPVRCFVRQYESKGSISITPLYSESLEAYEQPQMLEEIFEDIVAKLEIIAPVIIHE